MLILTSIIYRSKEGFVNTGISERVYGNEEYSEKEFHCNKTIPSSLYASETSFIYKRVKIAIGGLVTSYFLLLSSYLTSSFYDLFSEVTRVRYLLTWSW